jgi:hypothetical protein
MSYIIIDKNQQPSVVYDSEKKTIEFNNEILKNDVIHGIALPYYLQVQNRDRKILPFPTTKEEVANFAQIYRVVIFEEELRKHGFSLLEKDFRNRYLKA